MVFVEAIVAIIVIVWITLRYESPQRLVNGVYRQRDPYFHLKYLLLYGLLTVRKLSVRWKRQFCHFFYLKYEHTAMTEAELEKPQPLSVSPLAVDAVYFNGTAPSGHIFGIGTARRHDDIINGFVILRIPEFGSSMLVSPKYPATTLHQDQSERSGFAAEGLHIAPVTPMKEWHIKYDGDMKLDQDHSKIYSVEIRAVFKSARSYFTFHEDMKAATNARALALEPWSREYFQRLKKYHQYHYEQYGNVSGTARIDGKLYDFAVNSVRDHSFGAHRDWKLFHRYIMHFVTLENGDCFTLGVLCCPIMFSDFTVGFVSLAKDGSIHAVDKTSLRLFQIGENGEPQNDYGFSFTAGEERYDVLVKTSDRTDFYLGKEAECHIFECYGSYIVNGVKGTGVGEWQYRNIHGFPKLENAGLK